MSTKQRSIEILLVEDSPTDRLIASEALAQARLMNNLHWVADGVEAMDFLRRAGHYLTAPRPDLILLDLNLPRKDGREVLQEIKQDPALRLIPVVVMTTSKDEADILRAYGLQANCFIAKPVAFDAFASAIRAMETFWFEVVTLPRKPEETAAVIGRREPGMAKAAIGDRIRVLVVEDNPTDVLLLRAALERAFAPKFETFVASTLAEALVLVKSGEFDVILSDLALPDSEGLDSVRQLLVAAPRIPLLVLTANDDERMGIAAVMEGAQDYMQKGPDQIRTLARTLRLTVERVRMERLLHQSQRLETVGQLAGGVAHDFNNLLTVINGHVGLISDLPGLPLDVRESLGEIGAAVSRAASLTRQLLTFSRQQPFRRKAIDLNAVIGDLHKMLSRLIGEHVRIELQLAGDLPAIFADVGMVEQVVMNLAVNARDAMESGGKLTIRTDVAELRDGDSAFGVQGRDGAFVRLTMADTGCGMSAEVRKKIFEPFFTTKEPGKGTGLGLATVYGIIQQHEGWIDVESQVGRGSRFAIFFPIHPGPVAPSKAVGWAATAPGRGETILVVEDEDVLRAVLETTLSRAGYRVLMASSGPDALALWRDARLKVDLVVTDIVMPGGMTGVDLMEEIRRETPGIKHIFVSGYSTEFYRGRQTFVEGENFLQKPYSLAGMTQLIRAKLDGKPAVAVAMV